MTPLNEDLREDRAEDGGFGIISVSMGVEVLGGDE